jgi:hypothetical protein
MRPSTVVRGPLFRARRRRLLRAARTRPDRSGFRQLAVAEPGQGRRGDAQDEVGAGNLDLVVHALTEEAAAQHPAQARWLRTRLRRLSDMASARHQTAAAPARSIIPEGQGDSSPPMADVGVLFVHGIGQQVQGETLYAWEARLCGGSSAGSRRVAASCGRRCQYGPWLVPPLTPAASTACRCGATLRHHVQ